MTLCFIFTLFLYIFMNTPIFEKLLNESYKEFSKKKNSFVKSLKSNEAGRVLSIVDGVVTISGLDNVKAGELLKFPGDTLGMALNLNRSTVSAVLFGSERE